VVRPWREPGRPWRGRSRAAPLHEALNGRRHRARALRAAGGAACRACLRAVHLRDARSARSAPGCTTSSTVSSGCAFPQAKSALNRLQAAEIARDGIAARRGPLRDAITVFDENGALLAAPPPLWDALVAREWAAAVRGPCGRCGARPGCWSSATPFSSSCSTPRKGLTAHVWRAMLLWIQERTRTLWLAARCTGGSAGGQALHALAGAGHPRLVERQRELFLL
jgi:hypothetical protein